MIKKFFLLTGLTALLAAACTNTEAPSPCGPCPSEDQMKVQDMETYAFLHYSLNTYTGQEWGYGNEDLALFNPSKLDAGQWARTCKEAGMKGIIFTAKHHGGFCAWPSAYTDYSVKNTPWKDGKGDVVGELAEACRKEGLRFAVYLSPWDRNYAEYGREAYVEYFRNQLTELLSNYGDIFEVWFDGANGGNGWYGGADEHRKIGADYYGWDTTYKLVRSLQEHVCVWGAAEYGADMTWCGNERGSIGYPHWTPKRQGEPMNFESRRHGSEDGDLWCISEAAVSIRPGWFYHQREDSQVKSLSKLMEIYYTSVGRNGTLLLNFPITPDGLIHPIDSARGSAFRKMVETVFKDNLAQGAKVSATNERGGSRRYSASKAVDGREETYWATDDDVTTASLTIDFGHAATFNRFVAQEYVRLGQRVKDFSLEALVDGEWIELNDAISAPEDGLLTIGRKRIVCFPDVTATKLRFNILDSKACPLISNIGVYYAPELTPEIEDSGEKYAAAYELSREGMGITVALKSPASVSSFSYLPPQAAGSEGIITEYSILAETGEGWKEVACGEFSNIVNNPLWQTVSFDPVTTSRLKIVAKHLNAGTVPQASDLRVQ